jgi:hypothetical protein
MTMDPLAAFIVRIHNSRTDAATHESFPTRSSAEWRAKDLRSWHYITATVHTLVLSPELEAR